MTLDCSVLTMTGFALMFNAPLPFTPCTDLSWGCLSLRLILLMVFLLKPSRHSPMRKTTATESDMSDCLQACYCNSSSGCPKLESRATLECTIDEQCFIDTTRTYICLSFVTDMHPSSFHEEKKKLANTFPIGDYYEIVGVTGNTNAGAYDGPSGGSQSDLSPSAASEDTATSVDSSPSLSMDDTFDILTSPR